MTSFRERCAELFKNEDIKKEFREIIRPLGDIFYQQFYVYLWIICVYHIFLIFIVLAILYLLLNFMRSGGV
jgi:hypothetical protein